MKKKEIWILMIVAAAAAAAIFIPRLFASHSKADAESTSSSVKVQILYQNKVITEFDPNVNATYHVNGSYGGLDVEVKDGSWHVTNEECPNHICSKTGWVSVDTYQPIICIPNEVIVQIGAQ